MHRRRLLHKMIGSTLVALILVGCAGMPSEPATTSTPIPPTATSTPAPPTATPTPTLPPATPTPAAGIGVPVIGSGWQVTVAEARHENEVTRSGLTRMSGGSLGIQVSTTQPGSGFTFLVAKTIFRNLSSFDQVGVSADDVTVIGENGESYDAHDLSEPPGEFVFQIEEDAIDQVQVFELHFRDAPPIPFSVEQEADYAFETEIGAELGTLPYACTAEGLRSPGDAGWLTFYRQEETGLSLGYVEGHVGADGSNSTLVCSGIAFGDLQLAGDGAALLLVTPRQGWPSLYLIEPEGGTYVLVNSGLNIKARFDPSGRWVLFTAETVGETGKELYAFDRETASTTLVQAGERVTFDFLTDGRLITGYRKNEDSDHQYYVGPPDGSALKILELPEDIAGYAFVSENGQNLVYRDIDSSFRSFSLSITDLDGNNVRELAQSIGLRLYYVLSPDSQAILMGIGEGEIGDRVELCNLATDEIWTIAVGVDGADFGFSADGRWASVVTTVGDRHTLYIVRTADGSMREASDVVNAFFSPDNAQLAYTVRRPDGDPEMHVTPLDGENARLLGPGMLTGWFPLGTAP